MTGMPPQPTSPLLATLTQAAQLHQQGRLQDAELLYRNVLQQDPANADALHLLGVIEHQRGRHQQGVKLIEQALAINPRAEAFHSNLGECLRHLQQYDRAVEHFQQAVKLNPRFAPAYNSWGVVRRRQGALQEAAELFVKALECNPHLADAHANLGFIMRDLGRHERALAHCRQAVQGNPHSAAAQNNLANVLKDEGQIDEAMSHYRKAVQLQPTFGRAWSNLAYSKKYKPADQQELEAMRQIAGQTGLPREDQCHLQFALGKAHDDLGKWQEAFSHFRAANQLAEAKFDMTGFEEYIAAVIAHYDAEFFQRKSALGLDDQTPVFIVGMPRSGTSLVEQILASHPQAAGVGERKEIALISENLPVTLQTADPYPRCVEQLDQPTAQRLSRQYLEALWPAASDAAPEVIRIVDKMMTNYLHLGLIALLFPKAKVIHCRRNPLDVCLSCYFQDFSHSVGFAYNLRTLGRYYRNYAQLMEHWSDVLPMSMLEIEYEWLAANPEEGSRRLVEFCDLPWNDQCLKFYETRRVVRTASSFQVRQPVYTKSVERWRNYEPFLRPLQEELETQVGSPNTQN